MEKFCKSCGMPMDKPEDFANNDMNSDYCCYCGDRQDTYEKELEKEEYYKKKETKPKRKTTKKKQTKKVKKKAKKKR